MPTPPGDAPVRSFLSIGAPSGMGGRMEGCAVGQQPGDGLTAPSSLRPAFSIQTGLAGRSGPGKPGGVYTDPISQYHDLPFHQVAGGVQPRRRSPHVTGHLVLPTPQLTRAPQEGWNCVVGVAS
mmetsp:Transcript_35912/g.64213  ORF Transcript_35912/g.64213 Transcript_35912/m.64213 type:complete len:124 (-) Transcript_35912:3005-3376(-)